MAEVELLQHRKIKQHPRNYSRFHPLIRGPVLVSNLMGGTPWQTVSALTMRTDQAFVLSVQQLFTQSGNQPLPMMETLMEAELSQVLQRRYQALQLQI
jgi:hypothetical protein